MPDYLACTSSYPSASLCYVSLPCARFSFQYTLASSQEATFAVVYQKINSACSSRCTQPVCHSLRAIICRGFKVVLSQIPSTQWLCEYVAPVVLHLATYYIGCQPEAQPTLCQLCTKTPYNYTMITGLSLD